jgi:hypothetical protein
MLKISDGRLSRSQEGMWNWQCRNPATATFHQVLAIRVLRRLHHEALRRAWRTVMNRHPMLRATFHGDELSSTYRIAPEFEGDAEVRSQKLRGASEGELVEQLEIDSREPFQLDRAGSRMTVFELGDEEFVLLLNCHHMVSDGASWTPILADLSAAYAAYEQGVEPQLALPPETSFGEYVAWEAELLSGDRGRELAEFWRGELAGVVPLELPTDRPRSRSMDRTELVRFWIDEDVTEALRAMSHGKSGFRPVVAAYAAFLHRYTGQTDLLVDTPSARALQRRRRSLRQ